MSNTIRDFGLNVGIALVSVISIAFTWFISTSTYFNWREYGWIKTPHEVSSAHWYDIRSFQTFTRPPLSLYLHYIMGEVYSFLDPDTFSQVHLGAGKNTLTQPMIFAMRVILIFANAITYYPAAIFVVKQQFRGKSVLVTLLSLALLLNLPILSLVDYARNEVVGPHLAFLLLVAHFASGESFILATVALALGTLMNAPTVWFFIPVAAYAVACAAAKSNSRSQVTRAFHAAPMLVKMAITFVLVMVAVTFPLWYGANKSVTEVISMVFTSGKAVKSKYDVPLTLWRLMKWFMTADNIKNNAALVSILKNPSILLVSTSMGLLHLLMKRPTRETFLCAMATFGVSYYLFSYHPTEKDLCYLFIPVLLLPSHFKGLIPGIVCISGALIYPFCCAHWNEWVVEVATGAAVVMALVLEIFLTAEPESASGLGKVRDWCSRLFSVPVLGLAGTIDAIYRNANYHYGYRFRWRGPYEMAGFMACYLSILVFCGCSWVVLYLTATNKEAAKKVKGE